MNYYRDLRQASYNLQTSKMGEFDPVSSTVYLDQNVSRFLDASTGVAEYGLEPRGSPAISSFATYLHETIHWWQHVGSTSGLVYGLGIPTQAICTAKYLSETGVRLAKPLVHNVPDTLASDHPANLTLSRWSEIELGSALLFTPRRANTLLQANPRFYASLGHALMMLQISTVAGLSRTLDPAKTGLPDAAEWISIYNDFYKSQRRHFVPYEFLDLPIGLQDLMEGQARVSELQYRSLTIAALSYDEAIAEGSLNGFYGTALKEFLARTGLEAPKDFGHASVNLFLLVCDIAINPSTGYADSIDPESDFVHETHPGIRFLHLCSTVAKDTSIVQRLSHLGVDTYKAACDLLCERLKWATPLAVATRCLAQGKKMSEYATLQSDMHTGLFHPIDLPLRFYMGRHLEFLEAKLENPHFFCWPAQFLAFSDEQEEIAQRFKDLLSRFMPPFVTSSHDSGVTATNLTSWPKRALSKFTGEYFANQVLYDMARQWISNRGPFEFDYKWKPRMERSDLETFGSLFQNTFEIRHSDIPVGRAS